MYSYTLTFREEADKLTAPEHEIRLQSPAQAGDFIILSDGSRHQVMFVTHRAHYSSLYLDKGSASPRADADIVFRSLLLAMVREGFISPAQAPCRPGSSKPE